MLTYEDCVGLCHFDAREILVIADHEHIPEIAALEMAESMVNTEHGEQTIQNMIVEDIEVAGTTGDLARVESLQGVLRHFVATHPQPAAPG